jgi:hypothetical protein
LSFIFTIEPYYRQELNPHAPKLDDTLSSNDTIILRVLNPFPNACVKLILNHIQS